MASPPRRVLFLLLLASCLGNGSCCGSPEPECRSDAQCSGKEHCDTGCAQSCTEGCIDDSECDPEHGSHCSISVTSTVGNCAPGCYRDSECGPGQVCNAEFFQDIGSCVERPANQGGRAGTGGKSATGGKAGAGGRSGQGGAGGESGQGGGPAGAGGQGGGPAVVTEIDGCALLDDGSCHDLTDTEQLCCPLLGRRYDPENDCLVSDQAAGPIWCVPQPNDAPATCVYTSELACYDRLLDDGTHEIVIVENGVSALLTATFEPCAQPPLDPPACAGAGGAGGAAGQGGEAGQGGAG